MTTETRTIAVQACRDKAADRETAAGELDAMTQQAQGETE